MLQIFGVLSLGLCVLMCMSFVFDCFEFFLLVLFEFYGCFVGFSVTLLCPPCCCFVACSF